MLGHSQSSKRLQSIILQLQHTNEPKSLTVTKCGGKSEESSTDEHKSEVDTVSSRESSHQKNMKQPSVQKLLTPTKMMVNKISKFDIDHLDKIFGTKLHRYVNKWVRPKYGRYSGFVGNDDVVLFDIVRGQDLTTAMCFKRSGARKEVVWAKGEVKAAIVNCGGLCPGLNNVVSGLFHTLYYSYGVDCIFGINSGYGGFWRECHRPWLRLTPGIVEGITEEGGTELRSDRGGFRGHVDDIIHSLIEHGVNQVYVTGGDGTHRAALILSQEIRKRQLKITVVGIPKTIDNDIAVIDRSFGFNTSVAKAKEAILSAVVEAKCAPNCIGIVKLMGRHSGYIAAHATLASHSVDFCMIPEVDFKLEGENGILPYLQRTIEEKGYAVMVVAEGAGSNMIKGDGSKDAGGNLILPDIGDFLKSKIKGYFKGKFEDGQNIKIKYHDPSYMIRSIPANASDAYLCLLLSSNAVHGAMAGYTGFTSGLVNQRSVMIPMEIIIETSPSHLNKKGRTWQRVLAKTHQPRQD